MALAFEGSLLVRSVRSTHSLGRFMKFSGVLSFLLLLLLSLSAAIADGKEQPRVLLIGDSISIGYTPFVKKMFQGRADVRRIPGNGEHTGTGLLKIDQWLGEESWDVIHFNWGLWDLCYRHPESKNQGRRDKEKGAVTNPLDVFEVNLERLVIRLKKTKAKLVWANTTYVPKGELGRIFGDELKYNQAAARVMEKHGVMTNDLRALTASFSPDLFVAPGDVHYVQEGSRRLGSQVVDTIEKLLPETVFKVGLIGLDTSHVTAFTSRFNDADHPDHVPGCRVTAAFKGGSPDIPSSADRIENFTRILTEKYGVKLYDSIEEMCRHVDVVMLESVDGRPHLEQVIPVFEAGLPVFIDKPLAGSLKGAIAIDRLSKMHGVPCWSSSSLRYYPGVVEVAKAAKGELKGAISFGPASIEPNHPDFFWYGIHATEALFTVMGPGVKSVTRTHTPDNDVITGTWDDGKVGVVYGIRNSKAGYKVTAFGTKKIVEQSKSGNYTPMLREVIRFFRTREAPVSMEETIEIYAFMEAADESKRRGGVPVSLEEVLKANDWQGYPGKR